MGSGSQRRKQIHQKREESIKRAKNVRDFWSTQVQATSPTPAADLKSAYFIQIRKLIAQSFYPLQSAARKRSQKAMLRLKAIVQKVLWNLRRQKRRQAMV